MPQPQTQHASDRHLIVVSGAGRSGTSTAAGALSRLGYHVPQPEIRPNRSNPRGFYESRWVVDFHNKMLSAGDSTALDTRPQVRDTLRAIAQRPTNRSQLLEWLEVQLDSGNLVIKDPRTFWFLDLWRDTAQQLGANLKCLTMIRHPAEVVGSRDEYYAGDKSAEQRAANVIANLAGWVNCSLINEQQTRSSERVFLRYVDFLKDWRSTLREAGQSLDLPFRSHTFESPHPIDDFIDGDLRRVRATWNDISSPPWLRDIADEAWHLLGGEGGDISSDQVHAEIDALYQRYISQFTDSIALSRDHTRAAVRRAVRQARRKQAPAPPRLNAEATARPPGTAPPAATVEAKASLSGRVSNRLRRLTAAILSTRSKH